MRLSSLCILAVLSSSSVLSQDHAQNLASYKPLVYSTQTWQKSTFWEGPIWCRVGKDWQHPGQDYPSARAFLIPRTGQITITGRVYKLDRGGGDGVEALIKLDDQLLWSATIQPRDDQGVDPHLSLAVSQGQTLRFIVRPRQNHRCDSTHWDPRIAYPDGSSFQASQSFAAIQGHEGWRYELEIPPGRRAPAEPASPIGLAGLESLDLPHLVEWEWLREDAINDTAPDCYQAPIARHLSRTRALLDDLYRDNASTFAPYQSRLAQIQTAAADPRRCDRQLYLQLRWLKREIALANPLLRFQSLLFCKRVPTSYSHLVMQYFGWRARPGGGLFILDHPGSSLEPRDLLAGRLPPGSFLEPALSYDGRRIAFSYVSLQNASVSPRQTAPDNPDQAFFHIYTVNIDGSDLRQITSGPYDDLMPTWLLDGSIAFSSAPATTTSLPPTTNCAPSPHGSISTPSSSAPATPRTTPKNSAATP